MSLVLSTCVLFIVLMQTAHGVHFLNITSLMSLSVLATSAVTDVVPLTTIYASP